MFAYSYEQWHARRYMEAREREHLEVGVRAGLAGREAASRPLDERVLLAGGIATYRDADRLAGDAAYYRTLGYRVYVLDGKRFATTGAFYTKVRLMLDYGGRYEESSAGLTSALSTLRFSPTGRALIVFHDFDAFARQCRSLAADVLARFEDMSRRHLAYGRRMVTLLSCSAPAFDAFGTPSVATWTDLSATPATAQGGAVPTSVSGVPSSGVRPTTAAPAAPRADDTIVESVVDVA